MEAPDPENAISIGATERCPDGCGLQTSECDALYVRIVARVRARLTGLPQETIEEGPWRNAA
jgi:hypothetical protein